MRLEPSNTVLGPPFAPGVFSLVAPGGWASVDHSEVAMPRKPAKPDATNSSSPKPGEATPNPTPDPESGPVENPRWVDLTQQESGQGIAIIGARMPKRKP